MESKMSRRQKAFSSDIIKLALLLSLEFQTPRTEEDVMECLPNKEMTLSIMLVTKLLSDRGTKSLGDFEIEYQFDPIGAKAVSA